ncbi:MAG: undecaprenyl-diphosphate phosphatase [Verrucomicrobiales bacterium]
MTYLQAIFLGVLQGLTEFLPVSSSGHLVLAEGILGVNQGGGVTFELALHCGTLFSVLIYFRHELLTMASSLFRPGMRDERRLIALLVIGTLPAVFAGLFLRDYFESAYESPRFTSLMLCVTGLILFLPGWIQRRDGELGVPSALAMGIGQALAILPGISRSGSTIVAGMLAGVNPGRAAEFSFLLSVPAITGAVVLQSGEFTAIDPGLAGQYLAGMISPFVLGLAAVYAVLATIRKGKFQYFGYYCLAAGITGLFYFTFNPC